MKKDSSHHLKALYITALTTIAVLSIVGQILVQYVLNNQLKDSYVVNLAGRQRMLSQRISKNCLKIEKENFEIGGNHNELKTSFDRWVLVHEALLKGNDSLGDVNSEEIKKLFQNISPYFKTMAENVSVILNNQPSGNKEKLKVAVANILNSEGQFVKGMDLIVKQYELEAKERVSDVKRIELILLVITLAVLILEGLYIFRPAVRKINTTISELITAEGQTNIANQKLNQAQIELMQVNSELENRVLQRTKEVEEKNRELHLNIERLDRINKDLDNFVYTASHDLKAPINNIDALMKALETEHPQIINQAGPTIEMIHASIDKFKAVIMDLAEIGKAHKAGAPPERVRFKEVLEEIRISMKELIDSSNATIIDDFTKANEVKIVTNNLRSILYNLISNAIKYKLGNSSPVVHISTAIEKSEIVLSVKDNGIGVKKADIPLMFGMYSRIHNEVEGTGVGLAIVKSMVENHGGRIEVDSVEGEGTEFRVFFKS